MEGLLTGSLYFSCQIQLLALDEHTTPNVALLAINFAFALYYILEQLSLVVALGLRTYFAVFSRGFDAFIAFTNFVSLFTFRLWLPLIHMTIGRVFYTLERPLNFSVMGLSSEHRWLGICSLEHHRSAHSIFPGRFDLPQTEFFQAPAERDLRGHDFRLRQSSSRLPQRKAAFSMKLPIP